MDYWQYVQNNIKDRRENGMKPRNRILFGCYAMVLAIVGDYLLGYGTIGTSSNPDAYMGISWNVAPDWRYAVSSVLGFACAAMFAFVAVELLRVMEDRYRLADSKLYKIFNVANWSGILYFAFIHIGICMLPIKKGFLICCPVCGMLFGQLLNLISEGLDSVTESFGWLIMYLVCAICLAKDKERTAAS